MSDAEAPSLRNHEVAALVARAQAGDIAAFQRLIALYQPKVLSFARAFTGDPDEASDLAQEALIKVYRSLNSFRFQSSLPTWLFRIVKNTFLDHARSRRAHERGVEQRLDETHEAALTTDGDGAEARLLRDEEHRALWAALREVPEHFRTVLVLADMQGMSYEEVAAVIDAPLGTVKSRLKRGRDALRLSLLEQQKHSARRERA